ncbi:hypothetical protein L4D77_19335 [Photobacterium frigidiphilum]|uniref:hypothetical protein n=1 Tax=Photobacterium frigidiphilum TaxID=264736 RepID=UPI003D0B8FA6
MKKYAKWIILGIVGVVMLTLIVPYLFFPPKTAPIISNHQDASPPPLTASAPLALQPIAAPEIQDPVVISLNSQAMDVMRKSNLITQKTLDAQIAELTARATISPTPYAVPNITVLSEDTQISRDSNMGDMLNRLQLRGLVTSDNHITAFLSIDDNAPLSIKLGSVIHGVKVTRISNKGVRLTQGKQTRWLTGK